MVHRIFHGGGFQETWLARDASFDAGCQNAWLGCYRPLASENTTMDIIGLMTSGPRLSWENR
jgi:hypothetical protein